MKKFLTLMTMLLSLLMVFGLAGCSKKEEAAGLTLNDLYEQGFYPTTTSFSVSDDAKEGTWKGYYTKDGDWSKPYCVEISMTEEQNNELYEIVSDEEYQRLLCEKENIKIEDVSDKVPAADTYEKFIGKPVADLQAEGYELTGTLGAEDDSVILEFSKPGEYVYYIQLDQPVVYAQFDEANIDFATWNDWTIKSIEFKGFAFE